jgi:hypothetical protein
VNDHPANGKLDWLNCGITLNGDGGWNPPYVTPGDVVAVDLTKAVKNANTFAPCIKYIDIFEKYAAQVGGRIPLRNSPT